MAVVAYCRVSTGAQSLHVQEEIVRKYGVDKVFTKNEQLLFSCCNYPGCTWKQQSITIMKL